MEWFLSPSGEISCPRLSFCMQDIRMKGELDRHTLPPPHYQSLLSWTKKKLVCCRMFCGGCYYDLEAVCREYWTWWWWWLAFLLRFVWSSDETFSLPLPSLEGSVHSNDSLSDSSPPAPGVPTQVVQPVQTTQQVRRTHIHTNRMNLPLTM